MQYANAVPRSTLRIRDKDAKITYTQEYTYIPYVVSSCYKLNEYLTLE